MDDSFTRCVYARCYTLASTLLGMRLKDLSLCFPTDFIQLCILCYHVYLEAIALVFSWLDRPCQAICLAYLTPFISLAFCYQSLI